MENAMGPEHFVILRITHVKGERVVRPYSVRMLLRSTPGAGQEEMLQAALHEIERINDITLNPREYTVDFWHCAPNQLPPCPLTSARPPHL